MGHSDVGMALHSTHSDHRRETGRKRGERGEKGEGWSGRRDLNSGPLAPQARNINHLQTVLTGNKSLDTDRFGRQNATKGCLDSKPTPHVYSEDQVITRRPRGGHSPVGAEGRVAASAPGCPHARPSGSSAGPPGLKQRRDLLGVAHLHGANVQTQTCKRTPTTRKKEYTAGFGTL